MHEYEVVRPSGAGTNEQYGEHDYENLQIAIRNDIPLSLVQETFCHELMHLIRELTDTEDNDNKKEEHTCQVQGFLLCQILLDNDFLSYGENDNEIKTST